MKTECRKNFRSSASDTFTSVKDTGSERTSQNSDNVFKLKRDSGISKVLRTPAQDRLKRLQKLVKNGKIEKGQADLSNLQLELNTSNTLQSTEDGGIHKRIYKSVSNYISTFKATETSQTNHKPSSNSTSLDLNTQTNRSSSTTLLSESVNQRNLKRKSSTQEVDTSCSIKVAKYDVNFGSIVKLHKPIIDKIVKSDTKPLGNKHLSVNERLSNFRQALEQRKNSKKENKFHLFKKNKVENVMKTLPNFDDMEWESTNEIIKEIKLMRENECEVMPIKESDIISNNLIELSEKSNFTCLCVNKNDIYIVVDTNVFLQNLTFLDDLIKIKIIGNRRPILVVPYGVLQELDKLKCRQHSSVSTTAIRAIKYLNEKLQSNEDSIKGQTALEASRYLIEIENTDDRILNCCLQIQEDTMSVVLLSNDINMRNKAICNGIQVSTKQDLLEMKL